MAVLVTGGAGFIGSNLVHRLSNDGVRVRVLDDLSTGLLSNLDGADVEVVIGSITDPDMLARCTQGVDSIVHLAARGSVPRSIADPQATHDVNATGTLNVLQVAREVGTHVIVASSSSVYGENLALPKAEEMWCQPMSPYGASKLAAESYAMSFRNVYGMDVLTLRFFNVYGPKQRPDHDYAAVIPRFAYSALTGAPLHIHGDGLQSRDFTYVDSVVDLISDALSRGVQHDRPVNVAFGVRHTIMDVVRALESNVGHSVDLVYDPPRMGDVEHSENNPQLMHSLFPSVEPIALTEGISRTIAWLGDQHGPVNSSG